MKRHNNTVRGDVRISFDITKTEFDGLRERFHRIFRPISGAAPVGERDWSLVVEIRVSSPIHARSVDLHKSGSREVGECRYPQPVGRNDRFTILMSSDESLINVDEAAFVLASHFHEGLIVEDQMARLDQLADGCGSSFEAVRTRIFEDLQVTGNSCGYYDQNNSCLDYVIEQRLGIPITLSIVVMSIGRRVGRTFHGIGMPGHFLTKDADSDLYIDAFDRGAQLDELGCQQLFKQLHGPDAPWHQSMLAPIGPRGIVRRMLNNLAQVAILEHDHQSRVIATRLRSLLPDSSIWERAELARAYGASGDFEKASCVLEALAAEAPEDEADGFRFAAAGLRARLN